MVLSHSVTTFENHKEHAMMFQFENKTFEAVVIDKENESFVAYCYWIHKQRQIEIDIPEFFGKGFSSGVHSLLYDYIEKEEDEDEIDEDEDDVYEDEYENESE